jgi:hypothetical protein
MASLVKTLIAQLLMVEVYFHVVFLMLPCEAKCYRQDPTVLSCYDTISCIETAVILRSL